MFDDIGHKIQVVVKFAFWVNVFASVIIAIVCFAEEAVGVGLIFLLLVPFALWVSSFFAYGFGELVENSAIIAGKQGAKPSAQTSRSRQDDLPNI